MNIKIENGIAYPNPNMPTVPKSAIMCERAVIVHQDRNVTIEIVCNRGGSRFWFRAGQYSNGKTFSAWDAQELSFDEANEEIARLREINEEWEANRNDLLIDEMTTDLVEESDSPQIELFA